MDENYYVSHGGKVPVKWTAPEVGSVSMETGCVVTCSFHRPFTTRSTPLPVMCGALAVSCMRYGVLDTNHLRHITMQRLECMSQDQVARELRLVCYVDNITHHDAHTI